jgi:deazaflavin-dependent oxidoreductase (nitroreductase family)
VAADDYCYLTTTGRRSGRGHRIEIWYAADGSTLYLLAGGRLRADWVQNLVAEPTVTVEIDGVAHRGQARVLEGDADADEAARARRLVFDKYSTREPEDLTPWRDAALPVAIDLAAE